MRKDCTPFAEVLADAQLCYKTEPIEKKEARAFNQGTEAQRTALRGIFLHIPFMA